MEGGAMTRRLNRDELLRQLAAALDQPSEAANDSEPEIDEAAIRERARQAAERMRRARNR
jgi:hypothetical protein